MARVTLGSNDFFGVPFPVVVADRFFHIYTGTDGGMLIDVFRWDEDAERPTYEVVRSEPQVESIATNPTGVVTFSAEDGGFLFKFRPKPGVSNIFGRIPVQDEVHIHISDSRVRVMRGEVPVVTFESNAVSGVPIGIEVGADGSVRFGVNRLPKGMTLERRAS